MITTLPCAPHPVDNDSFVIPTFAAAPGGGWVGSHSLVVRGAQPVIVDTGSSLVREQWFEHVSSVVDLDDVRWVFVSHDDHDHVGNLLEVLDRCPNATLVASFLVAGRLSGDVTLPMHRMRWMNVGDTLDAGDRTFRAVLPPMFDSPATRGLLDTSNGLLWAVDSFGSLAQDAVFERADIVDELYDESFIALNAWNTPWLEWVDRLRFAQHVDSCRMLAPTAIASAHGPVLRGADIDDAFERTLALVAQPTPPMPGQPDLEAMIAMAFDAQMASV
ncbi:MAG TPA: MBL fold metallo-hydrolase [Ilumatobacteraceae bacterium]|nr:MBL fold metallo-hydrolase [Ilumatobacteraceae bacterium]